jgi:hypothetical protein
MSNNIPRKNDIIINPKTSRPIRVGGRAWKNLVNEGVIEGRYTDPKELGKITEDMDDNDIDEKIQSLDRKLPSNYQSVRGRGKYKNKIIKRRKPPKTKDLVKHTTKKSIKVIKENLDNLDFESELERMILEEVLKGDIPRDNSEEEKVEGSEEEDDEDDYEYY